MCTTTAWRRPQAGQRHVVRAWAGRAGRGRSPSHLQQHPQKRPDPAPWALQVQRVQNTPRATTCAGPEQAGHATHVSRRGTA